MIINYVTILKTPVLQIFKPKTLESLLTPLRLTFHIQSFRKALASEYT